jgi:hypothetical protein
MKKYFSKQKSFIILAIVIGLLINRTNCDPDPDCDSDPIYGSCSSSCEFGTTMQWATKSFGIWVVLNLGSFLTMENLKKREYLREFLNEENLKTTVREIEEEWKVEDDRIKKELKGLFRHKTGDLENKE